MSDCEENITFALTNYEVFNGAHICSDGLPVLFSYERDD